MRLDRACEEELVSPQSPNEIIMLNPCSLHDFREQKKILYRNIPLKMYSLIDSVLKLSPHQLQHSWLVHCAGPVQIDCKCKY